MFYELDFLAIGEGEKSGDAVLIRYNTEPQGRPIIHIIDGGRTDDDGKKIEEHFKNYYDNPRRIDHVVLTHPHSDHVGGLKHILENCEVGTFWCFQPWLHAKELIDKFPRWKNSDNLRKHFEEKFKESCELVEIAKRRGIDFKEEPFQGKRIGAFQVLAPSRKAYQEYIVQCDRTPGAVPASEGFSRLDSAMSSSRQEEELMEAEWGDERGFHQEDTGHLNNMSVVQVADLCGDRIMLTGDAGRAALMEALNYLGRGRGIGKITRFQVPHHGSRHNLSSEILDRLFGERFETEREMQGDSVRRFSAYISAAKDDPHHPRKAVIRALIHRGARVLSTERAGICIHRGVASREGWGTATELDYPRKQER